MSALDTRCFCKVCGYEVQVSFVECLFGKGPYKGWPRHCGKQMSMDETTCDIDKGMGEALAPVKEQIAAAREGRLVVE